jgi:predicted dehydrogenase
VGLETRGEGRTGDAMGPTRVGFVGAGGVARRHADVLGRFADVAIRGVADVAGDRARALAVAHAARAYADVDAMLAAEPLDAVYVCVPPFAHGAPERAVLAAGLALFVEKPLALDLDAAEELARAVDDAGVVTATGYHWRYLDGMQRARDALADAPARLAIAAWLDTVPPPAWWSQRRLSGGQTIEQTTHVLDVLLELMGDVASVHATAARSARPGFPDADVDDVTAGVLRFRSGAVASLASSCLLPARLRAGVELFGDGVRVDLREAGCTVERDGRTRTWTGGDEAKRRVDRDFIDAIQGRANRIRAPYAAALRTHRLGVTLSRSAAQGRPLDVP